MKTRTFTTMGALHPILFFIVVYSVALLFSIFICSSLFYSCQSRGTVANEQQVPVQKQEAPATLASAAMAH